MERYRLLETLRQYGHERLQLGEVETLRARHLTYYCELAEEATAQFGTDSATWVDRMDAEYTIIVRQMVAARAALGDEAWATAWAEDKQGRRQS